MGYSVLKTKYVLNGRSAFNPIIWKVVMQNAAKSTTDSPLITSRQPSNVFREPTNSPKEIPIITDNINLLMAPASKGSLLNTPYYYIIINTIGNKNISSNMFYSM